MMRRRTEMSLRGLAIGKSGFVKIWRREDLGLSFLVMNIKKKILKAEIFRSGYLVHDRKRYKRSVRRVFSPDPDI